MSHDQDGRSAHIYVKGRPSGSVTELAECSHGKREALGSSSGRATIFSFLVTFGVQCGFAARAASIKQCMSANILLYI